MPRFLILFTSAPANVASVTNGDKSRSSPPFVKPLDCSRLLQTVADVISQQGLNVKGNGKHVYIHSLKGLSKEIMLVLFQFRVIEAIDMMIPARGDTDRNCWSVNIHCYNKLYIPLK
jgi:hypothetical protein